MAVKNSGKTFDKKEALQILTAYCSREERCEHDVIEKMQLLNLSATDCEEILQYLKEKKFVDNSRYASAFVNDKFRFNKWGKIKISYALRLKKVNSSIIKEVLENIPEADYFALLKNEISKKANSIKANSEYEKKSKLYRFAISRGFENDIISKVLES